LLQTNFLCYFPVIIFPSFFELGAAF